MALDSHEKVSPTGDADEEPGGQTHEGADRKPSLSRRSYLIGTVAAIGGAAGLAEVSHGATTSVDIVEFGADPTGTDPINAVLTDALAQYDEVTFPPGEYLVSGDLNVSGDGWALRGTNATLVLNEASFVDLRGDGWTFDGFELDFRGQDGFAECLLGSPGDGGWTFGNVVFRGTYVLDEKDVLLVPSVRSGATGRMHDVYAHEGNAEGNEDGKPKLMWHDEAMSGSLVIERLWAERWSENTIYASDMEGSIVIRDSYFRNTNTGCLRVSEQLEAVGCTFVVDGPTPGQWNEERKGATEFKGVWCNFDRGSGNGRAVISDCDFYYTYEGGVGSGIEIDGPGDSLQIDDSRFHSTFDVRMIDGASEDVGQGGSGNVVSGGFDDNVSSIGCSTSSEPATDGQPPLPEPPALGYTPNGTDSGTTTPTGDDSGNWNTLRIEGDGDPSTGAEFTFTVSGDLRHLTPEEAVLQDGHGVSGSTATEDVWSGAEEYEFTGDITAFEVDGPATIYLNGDQTSIDAIVQGSDTSGSTGSNDSTGSTGSTGSNDSTDSTGSSGSNDSTNSDGSTGSTGSTTSHRLRIEGDGDPSTGAEFTFTVSGDLEHLTPGEAVLQDGHGVSGSTATEDVWSGAEEYEFTGVVTAFEIDGPATLYLDGEVRTVDELLDMLPNTVAIEGNGSGQGEYSFTVTGALEKHESLGTREDEDTIDGSSASGVIDAGDVDAYRFGGDLTSIELTGSATIALNP